MHKMIVFGAFVFILLVLNFAIYQKEDHIKNGKSVLLELVPVDPRSLMQGDYMALRFDIDRYIYASIYDTKNKHSDKSISMEINDGYVVVTLDKNNIATFDSLYRENTVLKKNQMLLQYRIRGGKVKFASNAFFFQEGTASAYDVARYGEFRVNDNHTLLLVDMYDENLRKIEVNATF